MPSSVFRSGTIVAIFLLMLGHLIYERSTDSSFRSIFSNDSYQMQRQNNLNPSSNNNQEDTSFDAGKPPGQRSTSFFQDPCQEVPLPSVTEFLRYLHTVTIICRNKVCLWIQICAQHKQTFPWEAGDNSDGNYSSF
ncbi:uncharacterized protein LOC143030176 [Oratosquilla oratoria]|uniref:uncharacterized protein LOC143030176 n=1 Tax=Oratosquilla oratoria TaxID=337810 RepID=UPI003F7650A0